MLKDLALAVISPITDIVKNRQNRKLKKQEAKATVERILTEASAKDAEIAGQIALANTQNQNNTWKDEYALIVITLPVVTGMVIGVAEAFGVVAPGTTETLMVSMFTPLEQLPPFWQSTFQAGILAALGVTAFKKLTN